jgi:hypothetical protein
MITLADRRLSSRLAKNRNAERLGDHADALHFQFRISGIASPRSSI